MTDTATVEKAGGHFHAVRFYENDESLCRIIAEFVGTGFASGQPGVIIATATHCKMVVKCLAQQRVDVDLMRREGDLHLLDAQEVLSMLISDGRVDAVRFEEQMAALIQKVCAGRKDCTIRIYGELVDVLWKQGLSVEAIRLEMLWNQLAATHDFSLLCGYSMGHFYKDATSVDDICKHHTHLMASSGETAPTEAA
jgi:hypothetical protein